jgi:hypothetical protein
MNVPNKAVNYVIANAGKFAQAKAMRVYLEEFRKSKKAILMGQSSLEAANAREQFAYSHPEYLELLHGLREAVEVEEKLKWDLIAAQARIDVWKTESYLEGRLERSVK